jgi:truncated hemoglobin YjbI
MSKPLLQRLAFEASGVTHEGSLEASRLRPSAYDRAGGSDGLLLLSTLFYDRVYADAGSDSSWFLNIFSSSTKSEAIDNQHRFLVQTLGGPPLYAEKKGGGRHTRLVGRHASYSIGPRAAERWVEHMVQAMREHPALGQDAEARRALEKYGGSKGRKCQVAGAVPFRVSLSPF